MADVIEKCWSEKLLLTFGFIKLLLVTAFFTSFVSISIIPANAETGETCTGMDLIAKTELEDPAAYTRMQDEAALVLNGKSIFWKVEKQGLPVSYLFGTMHMSDPEIGSAFQ